MQFIPENMAEVDQAIAGSLNLVMQRALTAMRIAKPSADEWLAAYLPLTEWVAQQRCDEPFLLLINGAQGSGKTTATALLKLIFSEHYQFRVATLSIDDFYLSQAQRQQLAVEIHPLLATRGVPGTHDIHYLATTLDQLKNGQPAYIPVFSKADDDLLPDSEWHAVTQPVDIIILEGWCVGARAQFGSQSVNESIKQPINELEQTEDCDGVWRDYINQQLQNHYEPVYAMAEGLVMLKAPDFNCVYDWRVLQEQKLQAIYPDKGMQPAELTRFIHHYERLTKHMLATMPAYADWVYHLNHAHWFDCVEC